MEVKYQFLGIEYEIIGERKEQLLRDFQYLEEIRDFKTINNRIINGTLWGWLKVIKNGKKESKNI